MELREEIQQVVREELKSFITEAMSRKDFIEMAREIRRANPQYHEVLTNFAVSIAKNQNPNFDEARFREAVKSGKGI